MKKDYYDILGVSKSDSAEDIQRAYRKGARRYHPDVNKEADAEERFKLLNEAHKVLSDSRKKTLYDRWGDDWEQVEQYEQANGVGSFEKRFRHADETVSNHRHTGSRYGDPRFYRDAGSDDGGGYEDILRDIFGGSFDGGHRFSGDFDPVPQPLRAELTLNLNDLIQQTLKEISISVDALDDSGAPQRRQKTIQVKIPRGITEGSTLRLKGQGQSGFADREAGDLLLTIRVNPDPRFRLAGFDLHSDVAITPWEAALGTKVDIQTVSGPVRLKIPSGTQSGKQFRLKGKGLSKKQGSGDLLITTRIMIPDSLSNDEKELFEELAAKSSFDPRKERETRSFEEAA